MLQDAYLSLVSQLRDFVGQNKVVLGLSGGIDSALTFRIAVDAVGADQLKVVLMPEEGVTALENVEHAVALCQAYGVDFFEVPISQMLRECVFEWEKEVPAENLELANMNLKPRIRAMALYHYANSFQALVLGTSNLSELLLGYGTKYGDLACDVQVIGSLYKTQVRAMAKFIELPEVFLLKSPSAELKKGQTDKGDLGEDYAVLDTILFFGEEKAYEMGVDSGLVKSVFERVEGNRHKSVMPPVLQVSLADLDL